MKKKVPKTATKTSKLRRLIKNAKSSGKDAWEAGKLLDEIFENECKKNKATFKNYLIEEKLNISPLTANKYIKIFKFFRLEDIENNALVTHLYPFLSDKIPPQLKMSLWRIMKKVITRFTNADIQGTLDYFKSRSSENFTDKEIEKKFKSIIRKNRIEKGNRTQRKEKTGKEIKSEHFKEVVNFFPYKPIDEQGLVGLFCATFPSLMRITFKYKNKDVKLSKIEYLRIEFPDCKIKIDDIKGDHYESLTAEFEFESSRYITHGHYKETTTCDLIICWRDDLSKKKKHKKAIPLVMSLEKIFEAGHINLMDYSATTKNT